MNGAKKIVKFSKELFDVSGEEKIGTIQIPLKGTNKKSVIKHVKRGRSRRTMRHRKSSDTIEADVIAPDDMKKNTAVFLEKIRTKGLRGQREDFRADRNYLPDGPKKAWAANELKNRYADVHCLDANRVVLKDCETDYIHASRISAGSKQFICAQGPLPQTNTHFWHMIWQESISVVIMLCNFIENNDEKSAEYFSPIKDKSLQIGEFKVTTIDVCPLENFEKITYHKFEVSHKGESRTIDHYQYDNWPDHGAPENTSNCIQFAKKIRRLPKDKKDAPTLVHCSAGVGRTGSFVGLELAIAALRNPDFSMVAVFKKMREQRMHAIQTEQQYAFIVCAVLDYLNEQQIFDDANYNKFVMAYEGFIARKKKKSMSNRKRSNSAEGDDAPA